MSTIVPYVPGMLRPQTAGRVLEEWPETTFVPIDRMDGWHYADVVRWYWPQHQDDELVIVEQDMLLPVGAAGAFRACERPWCVYSYWCDGQFINAGLGVVRFRWDAGRRPVLAALRRYPPPAWRWLDNALCEELQGRKLMPCSHGEVVHLREAAG